MLDATRTLASIHRTVAALALGATCFLSGVKVTRTSLLTYCVGGSYLSLDEAVEEAAYQSEERASVREEPSLYRAAEVVESRIAATRGIRGSFRVRCDKIVAGSPVFVATWRNDSWGPSSEDITALESLAAWARDMGLVASRVGFEVVATFRRPSLAKGQPSAGRKAVAS